LEVVTIPDETRRIERDTRIVSERLGHGGCFNPPFGRAKKNFKGKKKKCDGEKATPREEIKNKKGRPPLAVLDFSAPAFRCVQGNRAAR
jgi:hypothetical protein